jgi:hypothetical protein
MNSIDACLLAGQPCKVSEISLVANAFGSLLSKNAVVLVKKISRKKFKKMRDGLHVFGKADDEVAWKIAVSRMPVGSANFSAQ